MFFVYTNTGEIILWLKRMPDNTDFEVQRGDIWFEGRKVMGGVNWDVCDWEYTEDDISIDFEPSKYLYDPQTQEISLNPNWSSYED